MKTRPINAVHRDTSITNKISKMQFVRIFYRFTFDFLIFPECRRVRKWTPVKDWKWWFATWDEGRAAKTGLISHCVIISAGVSVGPLRLKWKEAHNHTHSRLLLMSTCWIKSRLWNWNCYPEQRRAHTEAKSASFPGKHRPARAPVTQEWSRKKEVKTPRGMSAFTLPVVQLPLAFNFLSSKHLWCASLSRAYLLWH